MLILCSYRRTLTSLAPAFLLCLAAGCSTSSLTSSRAGIGGLIGSTAGLIGGDYAAKKYGLTSAVTVAATGLGGALGYTGGAVMQTARTEKRTRMLPPLRKPALLPTSPQPQQIENPVQDSIDNSRWHDDYPDFWRESPDFDEEEDISLYQGVRPSISRIALEHAPVSPNTCDCLVIAIIV